MNVDLDAGLLKYFAAREKSRADQVAAVLERMTPRERRLVKEVAVMANVRGVMAGKAGDEKILPDSDVLFNVLGHCLAMSDLYPVVNRLARPRRVRSAT